MKANDIYVIAKSWIEKEHENSAVDWIKLMAEDLERKITYENNVIFNNRKKETLEEAAERILNLSELDGFRDFHLRQDLYTAFICGVKYEQKKNFNYEK